MPSDLPIITPDPPPRRSQAERYGALYYLGIGGLVLVVALVTWFGAEAWAMRETFWAIYVLHDASRSEGERIAAAEALSRDPNLTQRQAWDIAFRKPLPSRARYLLAECLTAEAVAGDPRGYAVTAARSAGWPDWFRLLIARPLAYAAADGLNLPREPLVELAGSPDPCLRLWMQYTLAVLDDSEARAELARAAREDSPTRELAALLDRALATDGRPRNAALSEATAWLRSHHPEAAAIWQEPPRREGG